jgi:predicted ATPase/class 3 adenylate cyclase
MPSGTVTFLFSDIEGSTGLWEDHATSMGPALRRHDEIMRQSIAEEGGVVFKTIGDAFCAAFCSATEALNAAVKAQLSLFEEPWPTPIPIRVRMGLHTGVAESRDRDYFGPTLNRVARLMSAGHGGQVLLSLVTAELVRNSFPAECTFISLGTYTLRGIATEQTIFQVQHPGLPADFPPVRSLEQVERVGNLPTSLSSFVGREADIEFAQRLFESARFVTIAGPGGTGKTRLAVQVASGLRDRFDRGAWLIELGAISDPKVVPQTIATILGVREKPDQPIAQTIVASVGASNVMLVLDNCEHLIEACVSVLVPILQGCPNLRVLATSREPLGISGEQVFRILGLYVPTLDEASTPDDLERFEATRLFTERARSAKPDFFITKASVKAAIQICARLDGMPMAIELAAARTRTLTVEEIDARLRDRFRLLKSADRSAAPRQQTLRALIDWSFESLNEQERILLRRLSVFAGAWNLGAAESVCGDDPIDALDVVELLTALVDKSLVIASEFRGQARFKLTETVREYSRERLAESGEEQRIRLNHAQTYLKFAESMEPQLKGPNQSELLELLQLEHDNFWTHWMRQANWTHSAPLERVSLSPSDGSGS